MSLHVHAPPRTLSHSVECVAVPVQACGRVQPSTSAWFHGGALVVHIGGAELHTPFPHLPARHGCVLSTSMRMQTFRHRRASDLTATLPHTHVNCLHAGGASWQQAATKRHAHAAAQQQLVRQLSMTLSVLSRTVIALLLPWVESLRLSPPRSSLT